MGLYKFRKAEEIFKKVLGKNKRYKVEDYFGRCMFMTAPQYIFSTIETRSGELVLYLHDYFNYNVLCYNPVNTRRKTGDYSPLIPIKLVMLDINRMKLR